jgi:hypothetical protein
VSHLISHSWLDIGHLGNGYATEIGRYAGQCYSLRVPVREPGVSTEWAGPEMVKCRLFGMRCLEIA